MQYIDLILQHGKFVDPLADVQVGQLQQFHRLFLSKFVRVFRIVGILHDMGFS